MGLFTLKRRMEEVVAYYRLTFFKWPWLLWPLTIIFAGSNVPVLIFSARPHEEGKIARYWWPATFSLIVFGSFIYWCVMMLMTIELGNKKREKTVKTIGSVVGFELRVFKADDEMPQDASQALEESIVQSRQDGSKRRVEYKVS
jgi:hypothetical protein